MWIYIEDESKWKCWMPFHYFQFLLNPYGSCVRRIINNNYKTVYMLIKMFTHDYLFKHFTSTYEAVKIFNNQIMCI